MKQVILLLAIHLLIFHQYQKDKKESPTRQNNFAAKNKIQHTPPISLYEARQKKDSSGFFQASYQFQSYTIGGMR